MKGESHKEPTKLFQRNTYFYKLKIFPISTKKSAPKLLFFIEKNSERFTLKVQFCHFVIRPQSKAKHSGMLIIGEDGHFCKIFLKKWVADAHWLRLK